MAAPAASYRVVLALVALVAALRATSSSFMLGSVAIAQAKSTAWASSPITALVTQMPDPRPSTQINTIIVMKTQMILNARLRMLRTLMALNTPVSEQHPNPQNAMCRTVSLLLHCVTISTPTTSPKMLGIHQ